LPVGSVFNRKRRHLK